MARIDAIIKGTSCFSSFRLRLGLGLGFHSSSRSIHNSSSSISNRNNSSPSILSNWKRLNHYGKNCQYEFERVHNLKIKSSFQKQHSKNKFRHSRLRNKFRHSRFRNKFRHPKLNRHSKNKFTNIDARFNLLDGVIHTRPLPSVNIFNHLLHAVTNMKHYSYSIHLFKQMCDIGVPVDEYSMSIAIKCYCHLYCTSNGFPVLGYFLKRGILPNVEIYNTLLDGFILEDKTHEAERLFKNIFKNKDACEPDLVTFNTMIKGLCKVGNNFIAIGLMRLMDVRGYKPDLVTYNTIIHSLCNDLMINDALKFFSEMVLHKAIQPNVVTYNSLIYALCKLDRWDDVSSILKQMQDENISPDLPTLTMLLDVFSKKGNIKEAELVFDIMFRSGNHPDIISYNSLIHGYCMRGEMNKAMSMFDSMGVKPNIDTYNSLLYGYVKLFELQEAVYLYDDLNNKEAKLKPNMATHFIMIEVWDRIDFPPEMTYSHRLKHVCREFPLSEALSLLHFGDLINYISESNSNLYGYVMKAATNCGKLDIARRLFHDIYPRWTKPYFCTYEVMISCLCEGGLLREGRQLFFKKEKSVNWEKNEVMINHLITGYVKKKPFDDVCIFFQQLKGRFYHISRSNKYLIKRQCVNTEATSRWSELIHDLSKKRVFSIMEVWETFHDGI